MSADLQAAILLEHCKALRMPGIAKSYESLARQARDDSWSFESFLQELLEAELSSRHDRAAQRRLVEARFPEVKTLAQIDWKALKGVSKQKMQELASCQYLKDGEDVVLAGPIGTGKTHLAIALGVEATTRRHRVAFVRASELVRQLHEAKDERALGRLHRRFQRVDLLILDELGFVPFDRTGGELLFHLLSERHERRSTMVTTNLAFSEWVQVFGDEKLTVALLDRLTQGAHILTTKGSSYRARRRKTGGAGSPNLASPEKKES